MKGLIFSKIFVIGFIFALSGNLMYCFADENAFSDATNILSQLLTTKGLILSSRQGFIIQDEQAQASPDSKDFKCINLISTNITREFAFKAQLSQGGHTPTVMRVAADKDRVSVVVETVSGQPYCVMTDHFLAICDPNKSGGLAYYEGGTVFWGGFQDVDRTDLRFQMVFMATNVPPAAIFDVRFILLHALVQATNASVGPDRGTIDVFTEKGLVRAGLSKANPNDSFGINHLELHGESAAFDFSDFRTKPSTSAGVPQVFSRNLLHLNLPLRALDKSDLNSLNLFIPDGFPRSEAEAKAASALLGLITHQKRNESAVF